MTNTEPTYNGLANSRRLQQLMHDAHPEMDSVLTTAQPCTGPPCEPGNLCPNCRNLAAYLQHVLGRVIWGYQMMEMDSGNGPKPTRVTNWPDRPPRKD
jgi:hypothetical protein